MARLPSRWFVPTLALSVSILASAAACEGDLDIGTIPQRGITARFEAKGATPPFLDVPFPSDAYVVNGRFGTIPGLERTFTRGGDLLGAQLQRINGWSRIAPALFVIDDPTAPKNTETGELGQAVIDRETLPADEDACKSDDSSVFLLDLEEADASKARVACRAISHDEHEVEGGRSLVAIGPARGVVLKEGRKYVAVLTSRVKDVKKKNVLPSDAFVATAIRKDGPLGALYGAAYDKAMATIGVALAKDNAKIVALAPYTTQNVTGEIHALRDALEAREVPALKWDEAALAPMGAVRFAAKIGGALPTGFSHSLDEWLGVASAKLDDGSDDPDEALPVRAHDKIAAFGTGVFDAVNYLQSRPAKYDDVDHATFARDGAGAPVPAPDKPTSKIWVSFAIPAAPMPAGGYPTVIIQHGLGGSRAYMLTLANRICAKGWIAVAIDSVTFGARASDPKLLVDQGTDYKSATYKGPDGLVDAVGDPPARAQSFDLFGGLKNIGAFRDQLRQAELDTAQLVQVLRSGPDLSPLKTGADAPKIDPEKIAYVGDSLGAIEGAAAAAIEPHVKAWTLNVGGAGLLTELAAHAPAINAQLSLAGSVNFGFRGGQFSEAHPVVVLGQALAEGGDPIAYADELVRATKPLAGAPTKPRNVLQIEVVYDEVVSNEANESLARAAGFGLVTPNVGTNAGVDDLATRAAYRGGGIKLIELQPDANGFHDTPVSGSTAVLVQASPGVHGNDLVRSRGLRRYKLPFNTKEGRLSVDQETPVDVPCPYRGLQDTMLRFFADAFEGKTPVVTGAPPPARDADGDGASDDTDNAPIDAKSR